MNVPNRDNPLADIDPKAQALSLAVNRITDLQRQMTDRVLAMAVEIEKLTEIIPAPETKAFLRARCNLPVTELSTYIGFAKTLKGSEGLLRKARASFPVVKALVAAEQDARQEILERMEIGARIDTRDVALIRRRLANAKLTPAEALTAANKKAVAAAIRLQAKVNAASFEEKVACFVDELRKHFRTDGERFPEAERELRERAGVLQDECNLLFGDARNDLASIRPATPAFRIAMARKVLGDFASGQLGEIGPVETSALSSLSGRSRMAVRGLTRKPLATVPPRHYRPRVIELCAGAGGLALGLERAGFEHVALIEKNRNATATLRVNRPHWNVVEADVRKVDFTQYRDLRINLLTGGLPCTPFSTVGQKKGQYDKNDLMREGVRAVREIAPKAFMFETVEGFLHSRHADYVAFLLREFSKAGYSAEIHRINARDYGIAQNRSRVMLVGLRKDLAGSFRMPRKFSQLNTNIGVVLADLMGANGWTGTDAWLQLMRDRDYRSDTIRGYQGSAREGEAIRSDKQQLRYAPPAKAAPTNEEASKKGFVPGLTNQMRARLQGFPDDWHFVGGIGAVADQIGNAVVPAVGQAMGLAMSSALQGWEIDWGAMMGGNGPVRKAIVPPSIDMKWTGANKVEEINETA